MDASGIENLEALVGPSAPIRAVDSVTVTIERDPVGEALATRTVIESDAERGRSLLKRTFGPDPAELVIEAYRDGTRGYSRTIRPGIEMDPTYKAVPSQYSLTQDLQLTQLEGILSQVTFDEVSVDGDYYRYEATVEEVAEGDGAVVFEIDSDGPIRRLSTELARNGEIDRLAIAYGSYNETAVDPPDWLSDAQVAISGDEGPVPAVDVSFEAEGEAVHVSLTAVDRADAVWVTAPAGSVTGGIAADGSQDGPYLLTADGRGGPGTTVEVNLPGVDQAIVTVLARLGERETIIDAYEYQRQP